MDVEGWLAVAAAIATPAVAVWGAAKLGLIDLAKGLRWLTGLFRYRLKEKITIAVTDAWWHASKQQDDSYAMQVRISCIITNAFPHGVGIIAPECHFFKTTAVLFNYQKALETREYLAESFMFLVPKVTGFKEGKTMRVKLVLRTNFDQRVVKRIRVRNGPNPYS